LEEAHVVVKHYRSDNGVFRVDLFTELHKEAGQTQSFSGVGAQFQHAEAGRIIQIIVYMARPFVTHAALNWDEDDSDNMLFWSSFLGHVA
jgi:hypothetical protein